jgi:hypothetical protein
MMGLDIGIMRIEHLDLPKGLPYRFAWNMAIDGAGDAYMHGGGNSWIPFTQRRMLLMLEEFAENKGLTDAEKQEVLEWVSSLPWDGWVDDLDLSIILDDDDDDDYDPVVDGPDDKHGGMIELYFNW